MPDAASLARPIHLDVLLEVAVGSPIGQMRAVPVCLGAGAPRAILLVYGADFDVDPYVGMFFFPTDTLKIALITDRGEMLWRRDLGRGVVPGVWFCPVFVFDLDGDGVDEVWFVDNVHTDHPLDWSGYRLDRVDAQTGETTGQWAWPNYAGRTQNLSHTFRNFIAGGHVRGEPVLVTAQGTYGDMYLQGWRPDMSPRWERRIAKADPGARGSHMCPITDLDRDGVEELMWGERCIELDAGSELFCADRDTYRGHSDIVQPVRDRSSGRWWIYTCREGDAQASPRVALFDDQGRRVWADVDVGHIDLGWVARLTDDGGLVASAVRIGTKTCGPDGRFHTGVDEFAFDALTGEPRQLGFSTYGTIPVDLNGDGRHELVRGRASRNGEVLDRHGRQIGSLGAATALACKFLDLPGEQLLAYYPDGVIRAWGDRNAHDCPEAMERYTHPFYQACKRLSGVGYNLTVLGGL